MLLKSTSPSSLRPQPDQHTPQLQDKQRTQLITVDRKFSLMNKEVKRQVENHL